MTKKRWPSLREIREIGDFVKYLYDDRNHPVYVVEGSLYVVDQSTGLVERLLTREI